MWRCVLNHAQSEKKKSFGDSQFLARMLWGAIGTNANSPLPGLGDSLDAFVRHSHFLPGLFQPKSKSYLAVSFLRIFSNTGTYSKFVCGSIGVVETLARSADNRLL